MKTARNIAVILIIMFVAACGHGTSENDAMQDAIDAFKGFSVLLDDPAIQPCVPPNTQTVCNCPGGGTFTLDAASGSIIMNECRSAAGLYYCGTITSTDGWQTVSADMSVFGTCSDVTGTAGTISCGGNLSFECPEWGFDCTIIEDTSAAGGCTLDC